MVKQLLYDLQAKSVFDSLGINLLALLSKDKIFPYFKWSDLLTESQLEFSLAFALANLFESVGKYELVGLLWE